MSNSTGSGLVPDLDQARRFLALLDPRAEEHCFQAFDDSDLRRGHLARIAYGSLESEAPRLTAWSEAGAGIFTAINQTDGFGRKIANVRKVRAVFADLDGAPLAPVLACELPPHIVVESSPNRFHCYWLVDGLPLDQFGPVQKAIAARFGGDPAVHDLSRCMRLPGFLNRKGAAFQTRIIRHA